MNNIKKIVEDKGRSLKWVAKQLAINEGNIYQWSQNRRQPNIFQLRDLARLLGVSMEELIN